MGKVNQGILGPVSGKVGGVVGASWKDKNYLRGYNVPANPNTVKQQNQRSKFSLAVNFAKLLVGQVFNVFTDKFLKGMSGYNYFISRNIDKFTEEPDYGALVITEGKLSVPTIQSPTVAEDYDSLEIEFSPQLGNNGKATDKVSAVVYDTEGKLMYFSAAPVLRSAGKITVNGDFSGDIRWVLWVFAAQYDGENLTMISNSSAFDMANP